MDPSEEKKDIQTSSKKKSYLRPAGIGLLLIVIAMALFFYLRPDSASELPPPLVSETATETSSETENTAEEEQVVEKETATSNLPETEAESASVLPMDIAPDVTAQAPLTPPVTEELQPAKTIEDKALSGCSLATDNIDTFYKNLDSHQYFKAYNIPPPSKDHFNELIQKLLANPPKVTGETDDLYTILRNTAHFFRISGKDNILMLKGVLNSERQFLEKLLSDYYLLLSSPDCSKIPYVSNISRDGLYEYACFFLNTMGGRLYLFRRDSLSRMAVTYYAILLIDQANQQNKNKHGISLKSAISMLISEMESGGAALQKSDLYLDTLYDLKEKYQ